jgi:hypothetical protein
MPHTSCAVALLHLACAENADHAGERAAGDMPEHGLLVDVGEHRPDEVERCATIVGRRRREGERLGVHRLAT